MEVVSTQHKQRRHPFRHLFSTNHPKVLDTRGTSETSLLSVYCSPTPGSPVILNITTARVEIVLCVAAAQAYNLDPSKHRKQLQLWSAHSLRVGACATLYAKGFSVMEIKFLLRWKSNAFMTLRPYLSVDTNATQYPKTKKTERGAGGSTVPLSYLMWTSLAPLCSLRACNLSDKRHGIITVVLWNPTVECRFQRTSIHFSVYTFHQYTTVVRETNGHGVSNLDTSEM